MAEENLKDQYITVSKLARALAKDRSFVSEIGLDEFPPDQVVQGLEMLFGFILEMYNAAKNIFSTYKTLTLDEKFIRLIYSRFVLYPRFSQRPLTRDLRDVLDPNALNYAKECYGEIKSSADQSECKWDDMPLYTKFFEICVRVLIEEDIVDAREVAEEDESQLMNLFCPVDSLFGTRPVLAVAFKALFSQINWELDEKAETTEVNLTTADNAQWALKKRGFPHKFVKGLREILSDEKFISLTVLAEKYHLFDQDLFAHPKVFTDIHDELTNVKIATLLTSMASQLCQRHIVDDGEEVLQITVTLRPKHYPARMTLALLYYESGRLSEAREQARRALTDWDTFKEQYKDVPSPPEYIVGPKEYEEFFLSLMQSIAEGKTFDKAGTVTKPPPKPSQRERTLKVIDRLDLILWEISKVVLSLYLERFPDDSERHNFTRVGTVVNELVKEKLRGEQIKFKGNNPYFVAEEKNKLLGMEKVRKGVINFLVAKAALYKSWGHSDADIWIERAKELEPDVEIPGTLDEISRVIESCLSYYESC